MEKRKILGVYDFRNQTVINFLENNEDTINLTILHETIHLLLTLQTRWGLFCYFTRRISVYDNSYEHIMNYLCTFSREVQEGTAVFCECVGLIKTGNYNSAEEHIAKLRESNEKYYKYLEPLIRFIELLDPVNNTKCNFTPETLITLVFGLSKVALNSDLSNLPLETIKSRELFNKIILDEKQSFKYIPNIRFNILLNECYDIIVNENFCDVNTILKKLSEYFETEYDNIQEILGTNDAYVNAYERFSSKIKLYFKELYKNSINKEQIEIFLDSMQVKEISYDQLSQYSIPATFNTFKQVSSSYREIKKLANVEQGILFYLGNMADLIKSDSDLLFIPKDVRVEINNLMKDKLYAVLYFDYKNKKTHSLLVSKNDIEDLFKKSKSPLVVNYKFYNRTNDTIGLNIDEKHFFVYCDRSYPNSIKLINTITNKKAKCRIIDYGTMQLLIVKLSNRTRFILPFLPISYKQILKDIRTNKINLELADNPDGITLTDEHIIMSQNIMHLYDLIINCLFST